MLYANDSSRSIAARIELSHTSIAKYIAIAREVLSENFVTEHIGVNSNSRRQLLNNRTDFEKTLYDLHDEQAVVVCDGTYIYVPKSSNNRFQRLTYSAHKGTNLVKPMMVVAPNGWILDAFGPDKFWNGSVSDSAIMLEMMDQEWFQLVFRRGDVFVVDRGFLRQGVPEKLESKGYIVKAPSNRQNNKLSAKEANKSSECTSVRWVVEVTNQDIKQNKMLSEQIDIKRVPTIVQDTRIAAAMHNAYGTRRVRQDASLKASKLLNSLDKPNLLKEIVEPYHLKKVTFHIMKDESIIDFPELTGRDLLQVCSNYQLRLARSYYFDHVHQGKWAFELIKENSHPNYTAGGIEIEATNALLVRGRVYSRHKSRTSYLMYILCDMSKNGYRSIVGHYCKCPIGERTVSPCVHVTTVIWHLGYGRNELDRPTAPSDFLNRYFESGILPPYADGDESDDEIEQ
jgi:hypothetical protein